MPQTSKYINKVAVVTGAARGIGAALTESITKNGGVVVAVDLDTRPLEKLPEDLRARVYAVQGDATDEVTVKKVFEMALNNFGKIDAIFANAGGVGVRGPIAETALSDFQETVNLLLNSVFLMFKNGVPIMREQGYGSFVATSSVASIHGGLGPHAYTAAKHAVKGLVESVAVEVAPYGITVNAIAPGGTVSSLSAGLLGDRDNTDAAYRSLAASSASGVPVTSEDVAAAAQFLAFEAPRITGTTLIIDGGDYVLPKHGRSHYQSVETNNK